MQIAISGKQIDVGDTLSAHVEERIQAGVSKYLDRVTDVTVVFSKNAGYLFTADIVVNTGTHDQSIKARAEGSDAYGCFDSAADKIEKQLRRYKRKLTNHHKTTANSKEILAEAMHYVIDSTEEEVTGDHPLVIAENMEPLQEFTVSEAVMRLDLSDSAALVFLNRAHGNVNVVYRRQDGHVGWIDPHAGNGERLQRAG